MTANLEERQSIITVSDRNTSTNTKVNEGIHETAEKLSDGSVKKSVPEDENPEMLFKIHEEKLSSRMNYASMLEGEQVCTSLSIGFVSRLWFFQWTKL